MNEKDVPEQNEDEKSDLILLIDREISDIRERIKLPGWSKWAIWGGIVTSISLLLSEIEKNQISFNTVKSILSIVVIALLFVVYFDIEISLLTKSSKNTRFTIINNETVNIYEWILLIIYALFAFTLIVQQQKVHWYFKFFTIIPLTFLFLCTLVALIFFFLNIPFRSNYTLKSTKILYACFSLFSLLGLIGYLLELRIDFTLFNEIRVAGLLLILCYLVFLLSASSQYAPLLNTLIRLRRKLLLHTISLKEAKEELDIILWGLKYSNIMQSILDDNLKAIEEFNKALLDFNEVLTSLQDLVKSIKNNLTELNLKKIDEQVDEYLKQLQIALEKVEIELGYVNQNLSKLKKKTKWIFYKPTSRDERTVLDIFFTKYRENTQESSYQLNNSKNNFKQVVGDIIDICETNKIKIPEGFMELQKEFNQFKK